MNEIRGVLPHDHPLVGTGMHILAEVRHLFADLASDMLLVEMTLADEPDLPGTQGRKLSPGSPRVLILRGDRKRAYVFGLLIDESLAAESTEIDALRIIDQIIQAGVDRTAGGHCPRGVAEPSTRRLEGNATTLSHLTARELDVLRWLTTGKTDRAISQQLSISERTVQYHLANIYKKLGVGRRSEAIAWAMHAGLSDV